VNVFLDRDRSLAPFHLKPCLALSLALVLIQLMVHR